MFRLYRTRIIISFNLSHHSSILQAEVFAIGKPPVSNASADNSSINNQGYNLVSHFDQKCLVMHGSSGECRQELAISFLLGGRLQMHWELWDSKRYCQEQCTATTRKCSLYADFVRRSARKIKMRWNDQPGYQTAKIICKTIDQIYIFINLLLL